MRKAITVIAHSWALGWELIVGDLGATQVRTLARAERQVRDYLDTIDPDVDHAGWAIEIVPALGPVSEEVRAAKAATVAAAAAQVEAGRRLRAVVRELRSQGLSLEDTACVLGVSKGRVSQLV
ncbi:MAG: antitoxin HicB [Propionibacteriaceae bacterium]|jgi:DNA-directed RNA polymerase specialized sigma24 family protein|nr:antitoxin HicB [Propionibacteriaceae bacterium]